MAQARQRRRWHPTRGAARQRLFAPFTLARHHLVLDLEAGTGLLTWEALRRVPEGGVWAHTSDKIAAVALHETTAHLAEIERPQVLQGPLATLAAQIAARDPDILFDAIVGRNALGALAHKEEVVAALHRYLAPQGRVSLVETLSRRSQRLYQLLDLQRLGDLGEHLVAAEETIYATPDNPRVNWDAADLEQMFQAAGFGAVQVRVEAVQSQRHIEPRYIEHWFNPGGEKRHTYAQHLTQHLDAGELRQVRKFFEQSLANRAVTWTTPQVFVVAKGRQESDAGAAPKN